MVITFIELNWMDASKGKGCRFGKVGVDPRGTRAKRSVGAGAHLRAPPLVVRQMRVGQVRALNKSTPFAEVVGADLSDFLADPAAGRKEMRRLLSTHGLVIFRGVTLTPAEELKVNELADYHVLRNESKGLNFGWSDEAALQEAGIATIPAVPEVVCQATTTGHGGRGTGGGGSGALASSTARLAVHKLKNRCVSVENHSARVIRFLHIMESTKQYRSNTSNTSRKLRYSVSDVTVTVHNTNCTR